MMSFVFTDEAAEIQETYVRDEQNTYRLKW